MFSSSDSETVAPLEDFPQSSIGAPCPAVIATGSTLILFFILEDQNTDWDGTTVRAAGVDSTEPCTVVHFERPTIHRFGPPNDEAFDGHRLAKKGLKPYGAFEVSNSEWIKQLEKMNAVHPYHNRHRFLDGKRHFVITFHDSVFECVARGYRVELMTGTIKDLLVAHAAGIKY